MPVLFRTGQSHGQRPTSNQQPSLRSSTGSADLLKVNPENRRASQTASSKSVDASKTVQQIRKKIAEIPKPPADWKHRCKDFYKRHKLKYLNPLVFIMIYMLIGALIFLWLERGNERHNIDAAMKAYYKEKELLTRRIEELLDRFPKKRDDQAMRARVTRRREIVRAVENFEQQLHFSVANDSKWDLATAMYFAGTLFTTIGYGDIACETAAGQIATVIYSCIGIPLMLITLNDLGKFLYLTINGCVKSVDDAWTYLGIFRICAKPKNQPDIRVDEVDIVEKGETHSITSIHSELGSSLSDREDDLDELLEEEENKIPRMSVKVALGITVSWIFFCAALFCIWETTWSYASSCYFMFISLSTIGLGDVQVQHRGKMVLCFVFVIIGLSLVSMTINVIQVAIEEMYMAFLMKLIMEYQEKIAAGGDAKGASIGMMRMWGNNRTAKLLMPLIGKEMKRTAMEKVEVEAQRKGIEVPSILKDVDTSTGMPKILQIAEQTHSKKAPVDEDVVIPELEAIVEKHQMEVAELPQIHMTPSVVSMLLLGHDADTQTEIVQMEDQSEQTVTSVAEDVATQTEYSEERTYENQEREVQTEPPVLHVVETQTAVRVFCDAETSTPTARTLDNDCQTTSNPVREQEIQTYIHEYADAETSTSVETKNIRIQTPHPQIMEKTIQSDDLTEGKSHSPSKMSSARKRIRRALRITTAARQRRSLDATPAMSDWVEDELAEDEEQGEDGEEDAGSVESLHWDPVDGLHAEKQLPVQKLKALFDRKHSLN